jgi:hypothetical protein
VISSNSANETFSYYESVDSDGNLQDPILTPLAYENTTPGTMFVWARLPIT